MDWEAVQAFLAIARTGRISAAARRLDVEHTTISRRITALEASLGVPLFYRTATGYLLTPHGQDALGQAEAMEAAALALSARARSRSGAAAGRVRVAMAPEFASHWLAPALVAFRAKHPRIEWQILVGTRQRDLTRGEAELAIQSPRPRPQHLVAVRLARTSVGLYAAKTRLPHPRWRVTDPESLAGIPLLTYTTAFQLLQDARWLQPILGTATIALQTNSTHALLAAARAGAGVAVLPRFVARRHRDLIDVSDDVANQDVWLITHPEFQRDPKVRAVADFIKATAGQPGGLR
ncbi:MAG TPA: LysR family transcriptional regulator [Vicinamibacterales bacterium]|nr:LysR family transcriptional regulator [Vicinamibacterales bacterium]